MPEQTGGPGDSAGAPESGPDFFDRLLARHSPAAARTAGPGRARVRPRLPGPFERVDAVRGAESTEDQEQAATLWPPAGAPSAVDEPAAAHREIRTEYERTVVHTRPSPARPAPEPDVPARPAADPPLPRLAAPPPSRRPRSPKGRQDTPGERERTSPDSVTPPAPLLSPTAKAPPASGTGTLRPLVGGDGTAARGAARAAAARTAARGGERVVHVQIGRLEVSAAAPGTARRRPDPAPSRSAANLSLEEYLMRRGRDVDGGRV